MKSKANLWQKDQLKANWVKLNDKWGTFLFIFFRWQWCVLIIFISFYVVYQYLTGNRSLAFEPSALKACFLKHKLIFGEANPWDNSAVTGIYSDVGQMFNSVGKNKKCSIVAFLLAKCEKETTTSVQHFGLVWLWRRFFTHRNTYKKKSVERLWASDSITVNLQESSKTSGGANHTFWLQSERLAREALWFAPPFSQTHCPFPPQGG